MTILDFVFILLLGLILASLLAGPVGWRHARTESAAGAWIFTLLVLIPMLWLAWVWIPPAGPAIMGFYWLGPLLAGLLIVFLLAAAAPPPSRKRLPRGGEPKAGEDQLAEAGVAAIFIDVMLWLFLLGAIALLVIGLVT